MKKFGMFIVSAVAAAFVTVMALNVTSVEAEEAPGVIIMVHTMADAVREMKYTEFYGYSDTVVYEDNMVSIAFGFEKCSEQEWMEVWEGFTPDMLEFANQEMIDSYGITIDDMHDIVTEGYFTTSASYRPYYTLVMV